MQSAEENSHSALGTLSRNKQQRRDKDETGIWLTIGAVAVGHSQYSLLAPVRLGQGLRHNGAVEMGARRFDVSSQEVRRRGHVPSH